MKLALSRESASKQKQKTQVQRYNTNISFEQSLVFNLQAEAQEHTLRVRLEISQLKFTIFLQFIGRHFYPFNTERCELADQEWADSSARPVFVQTTQCATLITCVDFTFIYDPKERHTCLPTARSRRTQALLHWLSYCRACFCKESSVS